MIQQIFTPVHKTIRMTPLTCLTTFLCCVISWYFTWTDPSFGDGFAKALCVCFVIGLLNMGVHELYHKWSKGKT